jgi:tight adherence protein B
MMSGKVGDVAPMTEMLKWASAGVTGLGLFAGTWAAAADRSGPAYRYWARYNSLLEQRLRPMFIFIPGEKITFGQLGAAFLLVTLNVLFSIPFWYAILAVIAVAPLIYIEKLRRERVEAIEEQLDNFMLALANALKTTPSIGAALNSVASVITDPMRQEVDLALKEMKVGSTLDQALLHMASRVGSRQLDSALSSVLIGRQVGGNLPRVLESTANTLREMRRLEGVVRTKTAEGKMQLWVIGIMPFALLVLMNQVWPGYFAPLTASFTGYLISTGIVASWATSIILARKVLAVDL